MQYELWARTRESKVYEFQDSFTDEKEKYYRIDTVDTEIYDEAMVLVTDYGKEPKLDIYVDLDKRPQREKIIREEKNNESIRTHKR